MNFELKGFPIEDNPDKSNDQPIFPVSVDFIATDYGEPSVFIRIHNRRLHTVATVEVEFFPESEEIKVILKRAGIDSAKAQKEAQFMCLDIPME